MDYVATHHELEETTQRLEREALVAEWAKSQISLVKGEQQAAKKD
jgi:hypothetical protein